jgi:Bacteriophage baseplate protein W
MSGYIAFPFSLSPEGRTRMVDRRKHLRHLIEQLLFTSPGERVMRPEFGTHLRKSLFAPLSPETASGMEAMVQGALQMQLAEDVAVLSVKAEASESELHVAVEYADRKTGDRVLEEFEGGLE